MAVSRELLDILVCPACKGKLEINEDMTALICRSCRLVYEIHNDIPVMLVDKAKPLEEKKSNHRCV